MTAIRRSILHLVALILLVQGVHAGCISGTISGEPLLFTDPESLSGTPESVNETVMARMAALPLSFIPNEGQTDPAVRFMVKGSGTSFSFTNTGMLFSMQPSPNETPVVITQNYIEAHESARVSGEDLLPGTANYFIGEDPENWRSNIPTYGAVRYHDLYPGIDLLYKGNGSVLKREFFVAPGVDPSLIRMKYDGADSLLVDESGSLNIIAGAGTMTESGPVCFQEIDGARVDVRARYVLSEGNELTIAVDAYDPAYELVIDPELEYSTYLGGSDDDQGYRIVVDASGNAYVTGTTRSTDFPTTSGAYQKTRPGGSDDAFVTKLNPEGSGLVYSTYLGGSQWDAGSGIAVDASGNAYVTGYTESNDFPTTNGAYQRENKGWLDLFVTKLNPEGSGLVYSTYLGDADDEYGRGIAVDGSGNAYVTGDTWSDNFPTTPGAYQREFKGSGDAFVTKLNPEGSGLVYSTYLGGSAQDGGSGIAVESSGYAYVTGFTNSDNFPTTNGAYQTAYGGDYYYDAFVTKLNPEGSALLYSTYLGGSKEDRGYGIAVESSGYAYVTGWTSSDDFPTTNGAYQTEHGGYDDAFVTKLNPTGSGLVYSTYLGGSQWDAGSGIAVDANGNAYVTGNTNGNFPTTPGATQPTHGGDSDAFVTKLNAAGSGLVYSTYLGGSAQDGGSGIAVESSGYAYVTGFTNSDNFPTTNGAYQTEHGGYDDVFVMKSSLTSAPSPTITSITPSTGYNTGRLATTITGTNFRAGVTAHLTRGTTRINGAVSSVTNTRFNAAFPLLGAPSGEYTLTVTNTDQTSATGTFTVMAEEYASIKRWGRPGSANNQFRSQKGIAVDRRGSVYVADTNNHRVVKYNQNGRFVKKWGARGAARGKFLRPADIAVDRSNNVYVADTGNHRIQKFNANGRLVKVWGTRGAGNNQLRSPAGIGVDKNRNVYVADTGNHRIVKFNTNGKFLKKWGAKGKGNGKFISPRDVAVDNRGFIYVADTGNHRIQKLRPNGVFLTKWGQAGAANGRFRLPSSIDVDSNNFVYVADTNNHRIQKFSNTGAFLTKWGAAGAGPRQLRAPQGLAVNAAGLVYVADTRNHRVSVWRKPAGSLSVESVEEVTPVPTVMKSFETPDVSRPVAAVPVVEMPVRAGHDIRPLSPAVIPQSPASPAIGHGGIPGNPLA